MKHDNQSYTYWDLTTACLARLLINAYYESMKSEYGIPRSAIKSNMRKIFHPLQCRNMSQLHKMMKTVEVPISNLRELL